MTPLQKAARELIDRQTPGWVNTEPTSRSIEMLRKALETEQAQEARTALEQYDLDQSSDYQKGWNDGRIKGYEVGHRYATEAKQAQLGEPVAWVKEDELTDLRSCNGRSIWAESPSIWFDEVPEHLVPVFTHSYPLLASEQAQAVEPVTDEENERFSQSVSNFNGSDPEATKYALEEFLKNRFTAIFE